jgi:hypothetical protein
MSAVADNRFYREPAQDQTQRIKRAAHRHARHAYIGDTLIIEEPRYRFVYADDTYLDGYTYEEAVLAVCAGQQLRMPWL